MGVFSYLSKESRKKRAVAKAVARANNKHMPKDYRRASLGQVVDWAKEKDADAIAGLVARFSVFAQPSIEDEEEKEWIHDVLVDVGRDALEALFSAVEGGAESISWHLRTLEMVVDGGEFDDKLIELVNQFDTEYERNPDRKIQLITALGERNDERVSSTLVKFLDDVDETVRFSTVKALANHGDEETTREPFINLLIKEESQRVKDELVDILYKLKWSVRGHRKAVEAVLPPGYKLDRQGALKKSARH